MKLIFRYFRPYRARIAWVIGLKFIGTMMELALPYIFEHLIDDVVPLGRLGPVFFWGGMMIVTAVLCRTINVLSNRRGVENAKSVAYDVRRDLFNKTANLSGTHCDAFGLPSLISRMTSDSYNVQSFAQQLQTICVRAPIMMLGGIIVTLTMDAALASILCVMLPVLLAVVITVSRRGIPLYRVVQEKLDDVVRVMRENITGIRVVKALSKTEYEKERFERHNAEMTRSDIRASTVMAIPGPFASIMLNTGLALVVLVGARRVDAGVMKPGVILAFLTYFNLILQGAMGLNRIFMMVSKASASADRIGQVLAVEEDQPVLPPEQAKQPSGGGFIRFEHVSFSYAASDDENAEDFGGGEREQCLCDVDFTLEKGEGLGIIGSTGCGKTTIVNLLMRFYDVSEGGVFLDGKDVRSYDKDALRRRFGVVFQNDAVFNDTLAGNIDFGRGVTRERMQAAVEEAQAAEFVAGLDEGLDYVAAIKGANLSGGQKQRLLIARALAADPEILILDDASSALDYKTDAALRRAIAATHPDATTILIAQRVSSVMGMTKILVMDNGRIIGCGSHAELLESCPTYKEIYDTQMGAIAG